MGNSLADFGMNWSSEASVLTLYIVHDVELSESLGKSRQFGMFEEAWRLAPASVQP